MDEQQTSGPTCIECHHVVEIVAKGLCRRCYDRARPKRGPLHGIVHGEKLSSDARALLLRAIEHRKRTGLLGCLDDLRMAGPEMSQGQALAAARECMSSGSGSYGFLPIYRKVSKKPTSSPSTEARNHS